MKYSIILPVRNGGQYVKECVFSIMSQTLANFNLIILDSSSTDGTTEWLHSLRDDRIIIHTSKKSLSIEENWARILSIPKNEFITLIGHDDLLDAYYLEEMDSLIQQHPTATLYQAHYRYIDFEGKIRRPCKPMEEVQQAHEFIAHHFLNSMDSMGTGYMMRSKDYDNLGGIAAYPNLLFADYHLFIQLMLLGFKATTYTTCFSYREHDSVSRTTGETKYQKAFLKYLTFIQELAVSHKKINITVDRYAHNFLMFHCQSLSHRLLKTPINTRDLKVDQFLNLCTEHAQKLIPDQSFEPRKVFKIKIAELFDSSSIGRNLFNLYKKFSS